jgi:hypothetical protein
MSESASLAHAVCQKNLKGKKQHEKPSITAFLPSFFRRTDWPD